MPELAFGYLIGFACTSVLVVLHVLLQLRKLKSKEMLLVQANLIKVNQFWSETESSIKPYTEHAFQADKEKSIISILISGAGFMFLSWLGFIFQLILMLSIRFLAVKRIEINLFFSELAKKEISKEAVEAEVKKLLS